MYDDFVDEKTVRRRILAHARHILQSIIEAYDEGLLDDPRKSSTLCALFALCAEGKVSASFDETTTRTKWSLTDDWTKHLREAERAILEPKIIKGPWKKTVDNDINT